LPSNVDTTALEAEIAEKLRREEAAQ
jgi:hypothetical protein